MIVTIYNLTAGPLVVRNPYTGTLAASGSSGSSKSLSNIPTSVIVGSAELQDLLNHGSIQITVAPDLVAVADPRLVGPSSTNWLSFANQAGTALAQYGVVRSVDATGSSTGLTNGVVAAEADSAPHAAGVIGVIQNAPAAATDVTGICRLAMNGDLTTIAFDLTSGHIEPVAGSLCYLSQTRSMYAQADLPGSGTIKSLGTVVSNGVAKVGDATTGLAIVCLNL